MKTTPDGCPSCARVKQRTHEEMQTLVHRLNRIEGQIRGLRRMLEEDAYCTDLLMQSAAVSAALHGFDCELLSDHLRTCVADDLRAGREDKIAELADTLRKLLK